MYHKMRSFLSLLSCVQFTMLLWISKHGCYQSTNFCSSIYSDTCCTIMVLMLLCHALHYDALVKDLRTQMSSYICLVEMFVQLCNYQPQLGFEQLKVSPQLLQQNQHANAQLYMLLLVASCTKRCSAPSVQLLLISLLHTTFSSKLQCRFC